TPFCTTSFAPVISLATAGLASNMCGSVFGLLMIDEACTYFPPTWAMTSAYSFSAPMTVILATEAPAAAGLPPAASVAAGEDEDDDEQALASRAAASGTAAARRPGRVRMTLYSRWKSRRTALVENEYRYDNHFH